jgi:predicted SprT family Zn-dependent metalloprotease
MNGNMNITKEGDEMVRLAKCRCGQSTRTFYIMTKEVREDLNKKCSNCGTKLKIQKQT